jgi:myo-inositol-1(or 4)-monophosphatase
VAFSIEDDLALLKAAGSEAALLALAYFKRDPKVWLKDGGSPVSEADLAVDRRLTEILRTARPDYGWLSEETVDSPERLERSRVFVIDPIDGTRAFLEGSDQWTISLAIVEDGRPISAVLVGPALSVSYWATAGGGAFDGKTRLKASATRDLSGALFASPRRYTRAVEAETGNPTRSRYVSSLAYRIALVASGEIDVAIVRPHARDWDLAAADLLVQEAGARLGDLSGEALRYNLRETGHSTLIATAPQLFNRVADLVNTIHARHEFEGRDGRYGGDARS